MAAAAGVLINVSRGVRNILKLCEVGSRLNVRDDVSSSGNGLLARLARPDTDRVATDGGLSAEGADVTGVLGDFHLLDLLTQGGTVSVGGRSVLFKLADICRIRICYATAPMLHLWCPLLQPIHSFPGLPLFLLEIVAQVGAVAPGIIESLKSSGCTNLTPYLPVTPTYNSNQRKLKI